MAAIKTTVTTQDPIDFMATVENDARRHDGFALLDMYRRVTGHAPKMWGQAMIGFGQYHYKSERSTQEADWPLAAFSPRKANLTLYITAGFDGLEDLLKKLGKHKTSVGCLYINKLADVDTAVLETLIGRAYQQAKDTLGS